MNPRVSNLHQIISNYKGTPDTARVGVKTTKNGTLQVAIGGNNPYDTAGRRVRQLRHTIAQLGKNKEEQTSYEGAKLKQFVREHGGKDLAQRLAEKGVFRGKVTFGDLKAIAEAFPEEVKEAELGSKETLPDALHRDPAPEPQLSPLNSSSKTPKAQAKNHWLKRASKKEKAFLNGPRNLSFRDLSEADQASIKTLVEVKLASLNQDKLEIGKKQYYQEAPTKKMAEQSMDDHQFPNLIDRIDNKIKSISDKGNVDPSAIHQEIMKGMLLVAELKGSTQKVPLAYRDKVENWLETTYEKLSDEFDSPSIINSKQLSVLQDFCTEAKQSFDTYCDLALKAADTHLAEQELKALETEPMDQIIQKSELSDDSKRFLLQELAQFTTTAEGLDLIQKPLEHYEQFISHLNSLMNETKLSDIPEVQEPAASIPSQPEVPASPKLEAAPLEPAEGSGRGVPYATVISNLVGNANNKKNLDLALNAYRKKRNPMTQLIQAKLLGQGEGMASIEEIYKSNDKIRNWVIQDMAPRITNQSLSLEEMGTMDRRITEYVVSKNDDLLLSLQFNEQDESLRELLKRKISQANPDLTEGQLDACTQNLVDAWYAAKDQIGSKSLITEGQIHGFLESLEAKIKA